MRILIVFLVAATFIACSSAKKQPELAQVQATHPALVVQDSQSTSKMASDIVKKEICESGQDKRILEVHKKPTGCDLSYSKFGKEKIVASGKFGVKHCQDSLDKITKKLEDDKFNCQGN